KKIDFLKGVSAKDNKGSKLKVTVKGKVDQKKAGKYSVIYSAKSKDKQTVQKKAVITVIDDHAPVFKGMTDKSIKQGDSFDPKNGVSAIDYSNKKIAFTVNGEVDTGKAGKYELEYKATDSRKHSTTVN